MKTTVVYHAGDFDGVFCREIAHHFLGEEDVTYIGWNFGGKPLVFPDEGTVYVMDLPCDAPFGFWFSPNTTVAHWPAGLERVIWIDHHKSAIESHSTDIPGYRIDGVAACRLAWQWFSTHRSKINGHPELPEKKKYQMREVHEPLSVRLAGEYDVWDHRDERALTWQYALRTFEFDREGWHRVLTDNNFVRELLTAGSASQLYAARVDKELVTTRSYKTKWEGLNWLVLNTGRFNSLTFAALDKPETGHDALLGYMYNGKVWTVSLYHAKHRTDLDLSAIAVRYGGGGHKGACGFTCETLPPWFFEERMGMGVTEKACGCK